jgi:hypothetical protein
MPQEKEQEQEESSEYLSRDDIEIEVSILDDEPDAVWVKFSGFDDDEDAEEYAEFLASTLPLLLFESRTIQ